MTHLVYCLIDNSNESLDTIWETYERAKARYEDLTKVAQNPLSYRIQRYEVLV